MGTVGVSYRIVQHISEAVSLLSAGYCFYLLAKFYVEEKRAAVFAGITYALTMLVVVLLSLPLGTILAYVVGVLAAFCSLCILEQENYEQKLFLAVTFFSLRGFCDAIAEIVYDNVYSYAEKTAFMRAHENLYLALYIGMCLLFQIVEFTCMAGGIYCILRVSTYRRTDMAKRGFGVLFLIPALTGALGFALLGYYRNFYIGKTGQSAGGYDLLELLYYGISIVTVLVAIALYQSTKAKQEEKLQEELLAAQMESMQLHIEHVERLYRDIRGMRHDMANHILTMEHLYEENQVGEARAYGMELKHALAQTAGEITSGNPVTDVILQMHKERAEKGGISFASQFYYPKDCGVNAFDVSIILNNALQNALEHVRDAADSSAHQSCCGHGPEQMRQNSVRLPQEEKLEGEKAGHTKKNDAHISVVSYRRNNAYLIEIANSFQGSLRMDWRGFPRSSKGEGHGYGLANIQKVAGKYAGDIDIAQEDGEFRLTIMLMLEETGS